MAQERRAGWNLEVLGVDLRGQREHSRAHPTGLCGLCKEEGGRGALEGPVRNSTAFATGRHGIRRRQAFRRRAEL